MSFALPALVAEPVTTVAVVLAQQPGSGDNGGQGEDFGKSSPVGLLVLILFLVAVAFLVRSMTKHLKRVPASFDSEEPETAPEDAEKSEKADPAPAAETESAEAEPPRKP